ncbi:hypothetical protein HETIRDRAFT_416733 [Heterobasidion irregulare TC 32-1]|uniref:Uncharacterized protein n=1 Tax=Heterobasidion irregulare (strain TC 32-1) TaxID=747525 RepID=W4KA03_HETIT|nr:uncharacterized protein HETIRDRAFT_416733 [Heterobasidion irregulare TC 32-1]ETW82608.1 hypothetical protein HETIRDRAFT_416733 [Heterobasidion irregulare TC 32-1]
MCKQNPLSVPLGIPEISLSAPDVYTTLKPYIVALACETGFYVLSIVTFALSTYILACKGLKTRAILVMWLATFFMFTVSTCHLVLQWIGDMDMVLSELWDLDPRNCTASYYSTEDGFSEAETVASYTDVYLSIINYVLSDAIVIWRVWIMWGRSAKVLIVLGSLSFGSILATAIWVPFGGLGSNNIIIIYSSTLAINAIATMLMAVKAWQHRRLIKAQLRNVEWKSQAGSILVLLVESGVIYCAIWIIFLVSWVCASITFDITTQAINEILPGIAIQVSGIYPTAIISLTGLQRTTWDMTIGKNISQNTPHAEMRLVTRNTRSGTSTIQNGHHHPTLSVDERPHISEVEARREEV